MNMQDPIADMLTRIRNAQATAKTEVAMPATKLKTAIAEVLKAEGYITDFHRETKEHLEDLVIILKYYEGEPVISKIKRISSPGRRVYASKDTIPVVENGLGITIISTSEGVMSDKQARRRGQGGEVLCAVS